MRYSTEPRHYIFVKEYGFLSLIKDMDNDISKSVSENLCGKYSKKRKDHDEESATVGLKK